MRKALEEVDLSMTCPKSKDGLHVWEIVWGNINEGWMHCKKCYGDFTIADIEQQARKGYVSIKDVENIAEITFDNEHELIRIEDWIALKDKAERRDENYSDGKTSEQDCRKTGAVGSSQATTTEEIGNTPRKTHLIKPNCQCNIVCQCLTCKEKPHSYSHDWIGKHVMKGHRTESWNIANQSPQTPVGLVSENAVRQEHRGGRAAEKTDDFERLWHTCGHAISPDCPECREIQGLEKAIKDMEKAVLAVPMNEISVVSKWLTPVVVEWRAEIAKYPKGEKRRGEGK